MTVRTPLRRRFLLLGAVLAVCASHAAAAPAGKDLPARAEDSRRGSATGLPVPRFVALGSSEVNVRTGPGNQYPIAWVYQRRGLPVEIVAEFEYYRKVRDRDGAEGWVHKNLLSGRRTALVVGQVRALNRDPDPGAPPVMFAEPGVQGRLKSCRNDWCEMEISGRSGFIPRQHVYGVYPGESFD